MFNGQHPRTYPSERDTRVVRVRSGDYAALVELAQAMGITAADALHETLKRVQFQSPKSEPKPESHNE